MAILAIRNANLAKLERLTDNKSDVSQMLGLILNPFPRINSRLFQTERFCRQQFPIRSKLQKVLHTGRKQWKKEKLPVSNFFFSLCVFKT